MVSEWAGVGGGAAASAAWAGACGVVERMVGWLGVVDVEAGVR